MTFCPVVPEICRGQFHGAKERKEKENNNNNKKNKKRSKNNKPPKHCLGDLIRHHTYQTTGGKNEPNIVFMRKS